MQKRRFVAAVVLSMLVGSVPVPALAEEQEEGQELEAVRVSDKRIKAETKEEPSYSRFAIPESSKAAVETFTKEDIKAMRPRDVYDVIESALGTGIMRQGARVNNWAKGRGGDNSAIGIILDGVYLSSTETQRVLGNLPVELIESVKIVRDSTLLVTGPLTGFGSSTGGSPNQGFIIITTRRADSRENEVRLSYGTFGTGKMSLFSGDRIGDKGYYGFAYVGATSDGKDNWNNAYDSKSFLINGGYADNGFTSNWTIYSNKGSREIQRFIRKDGKLYSNIWKYDPMDTELFSFSTAKQWDVHNTTTISYGYSEAEGDQYAYTTTLGGDEDAITNPNVAPKAFGDRTNDFNIGHTIVNGSNTFKFGAQFIHWYQLTEGTVPAKREKSSGYYLYDEKRVNDKLTVDGGYRIDKKKTVEGSVKYSDDGSTVKISDGQSADEATAVSLGAAYKLNPVYGLSARVSYNNTPTPDTLTTVGNLDLPAEKRYKYELGVTAKYSDAFNVTLTPFYYDIKNAKVANGTITVDTQSITVYKEADHLSRKGFELGMNGRLSNVLSYNAGYTWFTSSDSDEDVTNSHNKYTLKLNYKQDDVDGNITLLHVSSYMGSAPDPYKQPIGGFTTINASVSKSIDKTTRVTLFGQNLTDEKYSVFYKGYPGGTGKDADMGYFYDVGRTIGVEVTKQF